MNDTVDVCLLSVGSIYSLANIEQVLGIIILVIQIIWLCSKIVCKIYKKITRKTTEEVTNDEIQKISYLYEELIDEISDFEEEDNGNHK